MFAEIVEALRPFLSALILPPVPWLLLIGLGAVFALKKKPYRTVASALFSVSIVGLWLGSTHAMGIWLEARWVGDLPALTASQVKGFAKAENSGKTAIVVLGSGRLGLQHETNEPDLATQSIQRLRYGVLLAKQTGLPLAFTGGITASQRQASQWTEARIAELIAKRDFGVQIRWLEDQSRSTQENGKLLLPMLAKDGITHVVLVTNAYHMPRSLRAFQTAATQQGLPIKISPAPMGFTLPADSLAVSLMPSVNGFRDVTQVWREWVGWHLGR